MMMVWAKMIGITPAVISRIGMNVFCPSRMRPRPITLRGIWIGMRRAAMVMPVTAAMDATRTARNRMPPGSETTPARRYPRSCSVPGHIRSRIDTVMRRLIPFPMPRSVICSPSHITNTAPAVSVTTMISRDANPGFGIAPGMLSVNSVNVYAWESEMKMAT